MKALFEKIDFGKDNSLQIKHLLLAHFDAPWHYHPEYELTYIIQSQGKRFVGDHIESFSEGDLVLMGPNLPHFWRNDESYYEPDNKQIAEAIVIQFDQKLGDQWLPQLPESSTLRTLLARANHGLRFSEAKVEEAKPLLYNLLHLEGMPLLLGVLQLLVCLAADSDAVMLASDGYQLIASEAESERMKRVLDYMLEHFRHDIRIDDIASVAGMAPAAFCRYFRRRTRKSFIEYLNELRISHARKLLLHSNNSVGQVGLECGFNNISHFHRQFKLYTGTTPLRYQYLQRMK
ncbi:helix-turn-helix domain-containing protein [Tellurirhabdus bombi]|uniref:helix-turn-helix domain-containing protein n=1 Tax=Tellurirhabdus bombi TaxID=2907205 RepID=UPI001F3008A4|nr:AraC family transcriptional regulator [Tellurirhabdus bombi]